jgi:hypothetical protein
MKFLLVAIVYFSLSQKADSQDSILVTRQFENDKPATAIDSFFHKIPNTIFVSLYEGFDDSVYVTINGIPFLNKYLKTNESIGYASGFVIHFKDSTEIKDLTIKFVNGNRYIHERVNLRYKSLQIRGIRHWLLIYTNHFPMLE